MLSKEEKKEIIQDALSKRRHLNFRKSSLSQKPQCTLDEYIEFLMQIQEIFSPFSINKNKTNTQFNKL